MIRRYSELILLETFEERFEYLKLFGEVGESTFGFDRYLNQILYHSDEWSWARNEVIIRDQGCDLGSLDREIHGKIVIHHMNPVTKEDLINHSPDLLNPEFLITTSMNTHNAIHYGDSRLLGSVPIERSRNDTSPWRLQ